MPIDYSKYPKNWQELRAAVLERANHSCEFCGLPNYAIGSRDSNGKFYTAQEVRAMGKIGRRHKFGEDGLKTLKIVLTTAHLDHDESNHEVKIERLRALCQKCHLNYDSDEKKLRRAEKKYKGSIFPFERK